MSRLLLLAAALTLGACASTKSADHDGHDHDHDHEPMVLEVVEEAYPLSECPVSGQPLPAEGYAAVTLGDLEARFCCPACATTAAGDPETWGPIVEDALIEAQLAGYPLTTCVVGGHDLGSMGEPVNMLAGDTLVRLCCAGCAGAVAADPETFATKVADAR